jgi:hypothetical protein
MADLRRPSIPDGIAPIVAYRAWTYGVGDRFGTLGPISMRGANGVSVWDGAGSSWVVASCHKADPLVEELAWAMALHRAPDEGCACGFYAVKDLSLLQMLAGDSSGYVLGRVKLAGKIVEHEFGYRAELARIVELFPWRGAEHLVSRLALRIGVAVGDSVAPFADMPPDHDPSDHDPSSPRRPMRTWVRSPGSESVATISVRLAA